MLYMIDIDMNIPDYIYFGRVSSVYLIFLVIFHMLDIHEYSSIPLIFPSCGQLYQYFCFSAPFQKFSKQSALPSPFPLPRWAPLFLRCPKG
jgi:hypothetical protein